MHPSAGVKRARPQDDQPSSGASMSSDASLCIGARVTQRPRREDPSDRDAQSQAQDHSVHPTAAAAASALTAATRIPQTDQEAAPADRSTETVSASATAAIHQPAVPQLSPLQPPGAAAPSAQAVAAVPCLQLSPAQRCDPDSLSLVFAHLGTADFLSAIRVCCQWRSARMKPTAWPQLHVPSLIQSLRDDNCDSPNHRRLNVSIRPYGLSALAALLGPSATAAVGSAPASAGSMWRHVTDVKLSASFPCSAGNLPRGVACGRAPEEVAQLPHLSALHLRGWTADDDAVAAFYSAVSTRLQALLLFHCSSAFLSHLPFLSNLRALVVDRMPAANDLIPLQRLEYLRFDSHLKRPEWHLMGLFMIVQPPSAVATALRWLSSEHSLRSLSVEAEYFDSDYWEPLFLPAQTAQEAAEFAEFIAAQAPTAPVVVDWTKPCGLTDVSMMGELSETLVSSICALPQLTRLQCPSRHLWQGDPPPVSTLAKLQRLSLLWCAPEGVRSAMGLDPFPAWQQLSQLRVLELASASAHVSGRVAMSAADLQRLLATCTTTLEELRLGPSIRINHASGEAGASAASTGSFASSSLTAIAARRIQVPNGWSVLAQCTQLRVLKIALQSATTSIGMLAALALLPRFQSLELDMTGGVYLGHGFSLPADLRLCLRHSSSWCSLHIHWPSNYVYGDLLLGDGGLPQQLPPDSASAAVSTRLCVYDHIPQSAMVRSYAIRADPNGVKRWQLV